jgi:hypothetical protein
LLKLGGCLFQLNLI